MLGDIQGYCVLKSTNTVKGYAGDPKELLDAFILRIVDVAVDNSGFLVLNKQGTALAMVDMPDVQMHFLCSTLGGVILPPKLSFAEQWREVAKRVMIKGGYTDIVRSAVIATSLIQNKFNDDFLFSKN